MKLRNIVLAAAFALAALSISLDKAHAGGDMSASRPEGDFSFGRAGQKNQTRYHYRAPYGADYGYAYGRNYIFGSYYKPYRLQYYSYTYPNYYTHYYPRRRRSRWYDHAPRYRAPYSGYSYRYR